MTITLHNLGFPRIGKKRELKFALEDYWNGKISQSQLRQTASALRQQHWQQQNKMNWVPVGDFSFYDHVLDTSFLLGNIPARFADEKSNTLDQYFSVARGRSTDSQSSCHCAHAGEMTKWFNSNYHYIVPEFNRNTEFNLHAENLLDQVREAQQQGYQAKVVVLSPVSYLWLGKSKDASNRLDLLEKLLPVYQQLLQQLQQHGVEWVQIDEPILSLELDKAWQNAIEKSYLQFNTIKRPKLLLTTYFGSLQQNLPLACQLNIDGLHLDSINAASEIFQAIKLLDNNKVLSLGVIDGRNIWKADLEQLIEWLTPIHRQLGSRLWLAPSCSLLHVPVDLNSEQNMDGEIKNWLAFAVQKLDELHILAQALNHGRESVHQALQQNRAAMEDKANSGKIRNPEVQQRLKELPDKADKRQSPYAQRSQSQRQRFHLPLLPSTTIGSFPQTAQIRQARKAWRLKEISHQDYITLMKKEIAYCIEQQEELGLDVFVHGEPERNDMVEYFGQQLNGYTFSEFGWVQSYGSRCVKPPIIYGDISRPQAMTVEWIKYAQSLSNKPVKGMLTGPVTMLNWSFVRNDQSRAQTCLQLALAIRDEVLELEQAGIGIIQIDEAALREGLPLRKSEWNEYLDWATYSFRICANGVQDTTQIHTHMCYSEFNDIIDAIADMDADVITIETARSDMELLDVFDRFNYPNEIGPGVYDIHSPNIPTVESIVELIDKASMRIPAERLWINPDCGLKTRKWEEVIPALQNMVKAAQILRKKFQKG